MGYEGKPGYSPIGEVGAVQVFKEYKNFEEMAIALGISNDQFKSVLNAATKKTVSWGSKESAKGLGQALKVPYPTMRKRIRAKMKKVVGSIWLGFNDLAVKYEDPKITNTGVTAAGKDYPGAFRVKKLHDHIFRRTGYNRKIERVDDNIDPVASRYLDSTLSEKIQNYFLDQFFIELDRMSGGKSYSTTSLGVANQLSPKTTTK